MTSMVAARPHHPQGLPKLGRDDFQRATASTARFYRMVPRCGKAYSSTDAVRKHCRQRHLEWLRRLGHEWALYCEWDEE